MQDLHKALKMLGLNPTDQEVVDMPNYIAKYDWFQTACRTFIIIHRDGLIYFPEFCHLVLGRLREDPEKEEEFNKNMFKVRLILNP